MSEELTPKVLELKALFESLPCNQGLSDEFLLDLTKKYTLLEISRCHCIFNNLTTPFIHDLIKLIMTFQEMVNYSKGDIQKDLTLVAFIIMVDDFDKLHSLTCPNTGKRLMDIIHPVEVKALY